jgi:hypothetical protein
VAAILNILVLSGSSGTSAVDICQNLITMKQNFLPENKRKQENRELTKDKYTETVK